jgi:hypothetical protein
LVDYVYRSGFGDTSLWTFAGLRGRGITAIDGFLIEPLIASNKMFIKFIGEEPKK